MTSLERFLDIIARSFPGWTRPFDEDAWNEIERLDPDKIYVENIRKILGTTGKSAQEACDAAVRQGVFTRYVEVLCPDGSQAAYARSEEELPEVVTCWIRKDGEEQPEELKTNELDKLRFYQLDDSRQPAGE